MSTLNVFAKDMNKLAGTVQVNIVKLQKQVAEEVVSFVSTATPVLTGQASGNWITSIGTPASGWTQGVSSAGVSIAQAKAALIALSSGQVVHITNNVPYIVKLNQGYSKQAPLAFVELAAVSALGSIGRFNLLVK